jgi:uncharacterized protein (TIGR02271 family)
MVHTVVGVYDDHTQAQCARDQLIDSGFAPHDVTISSQEQPASAQPEDSAEVHKEAGMMHFFDSLISAIGDSEQSDRNAQTARRGRHWLTVHADTEARCACATDIMHRHGPTDIGQRAIQGPARASAGTGLPVPDQADERRASGSSAAGNNGNASGPEMTPENPTAGPQEISGGTLEGETRIPVVQEELQICTREVLRGGVRVHQRVIDTPVHEQVQLREEHVTIERRPVNRPATAADAAAFSEASFEVRAMAEEAVVEKSARVVEEVIVHRTVTERTQTINDSVRRTDVQIEALDDDTQNAAATGESVNDDSEFRRHWQSAHGDAVGGRYEDAAPAYRFGFRIRHDARYREREWEDAEPDIRSDWTQQQEGPPWESAREAIRYGWHKVTR